MSKVILPIEWRTLVTMPEWHAQMAAVDRLCDTRVEVLNVDGTNLGDVPADGGTVSFQGESSEQWQGELNLSDPAIFPLLDTDPLHPLAKNQIRVWWQEFIPALSGWGEVPLMTGWPENPKGSDAGTASWTLQLWDSITEAKRGGYGTASIEVGGMTVTAALGALFDVVAPRMPRLIPESTIILPATYVLGEKEPSEDWTEIAKLAGWVVRSCREGTIVAGPAPDPSEPLVDWQEGDLCRVVSIQRELVTGTLKNAWIAKSTSAEIVPPIVGVWEDTDEGSATWVGRFRYTGRIESDAIADLAGAVNMAKAAYEQNHRPMDDTELSAPGRPDLDYRDLIPLSRKWLGVAGSYRVSSWRLPLPGGGRNPDLMQVTMMSRAA